MRLGQLTRAKFSEGDEIMYHGHIYKVDKVHRAHGGFLYDFGKHEKVDELFVEEVPFSKKFIQDQQQIGSLST